MEKILIIIPTYNEMDNLPRLIAEIEKLGLGIEVLIVDDNSPDGTGTWVERQMAQKQHLHLIQREGKQGLGSAYVRGFKYAIKNNFNLIFEMDADFSHDPKYISNFLYKIKEFDLVLGSRYIKGVNVVNWPMSRLLLSYMANIYARLVTGIPVRDSTGGFKCFRVEALKALDLDAVKSDGYCFQIEVTYKLWKKNFRICEIPIVFVDRVAGESKMSGKIIREAMFLIFKLRFGKKN
jgi:dolichol-phosphate mannosyltransferase